MEQMFSGHYDELRRRARMLARDMSEADDILQEAFLSALRNPQFDGLDEAAQLNWLRRAMKSRLIDIRRREKLQRERMPLPGDESFSDDLSAVEVAQALGMLDDDQRVVVAMKVMGGMNSAEIARTLDIPAATVRTRLRAAVKKLRELRKQEMI